jgi:hypothetical protein
MTERKDELAAEERPAATNVDPQEPEATDGVAEAREEEVAGTETERPAKRVDRRRLQRNLSWALFLIAIGFDVVFFILWRGAVSDRDQARQVERGRAEVTDTATTFLDALTNFKGSTISEDVDRIRSFAVGDFAGQVDRFFSAKAMDALRKAKAESVGQVQAVFVESLSADTASVFAVVQETITNASTTAPKPQTLRIELQMIKTGDGWKVNRVDILQTPGGASIPGG